MKTSKLEGLRERRRRIMAGGGDDKIKARHEKGLMTARDRLGALFQPDTFQESGMHIRHSGRHFGTDGKDIPADAIVTGTGYVNGQLVAAVAQDFTVSGGTVGKMHATKIVESLLVTIGQEIRAGDRVIVIEAMKMKTPITAHQGGKVADVLVDVGDGVQTGQVLVKLT